MEGKWRLAKTFKRSGKNHSYFLDFEGMEEKNGKLFFVKSIGRTIGMKEVVDDKETVFYCEIIKCERVNRRTLVTLKNIEDGFEFEPIGASEIALGKLSNLFNLIRYREPWMKEYFKDESLADSLTCSSPKKVECICPICGCEKEIIVFNLSRQGYGCKCTQELPYTERLMESVLKYIKFDYDFQFTFEGSNYKYDFYLPKYNAIIETHGKQHYDGSFSKWGGRTLEEEQENDKNKRELALANGVESEDYHEIDCRNSTLEWCKPNIEKVLSLYLTDEELKNIDWVEIEIEAQRNKKLDVVEFWNKNKLINPSLTTTEVSNALNVPIYTVINFLNWGTKYGLCYYNGAEEMKANTKRKSHPILIINEQGEIIEEYQSIREMSRLTGVGKTTILEHLKNKAPFLGGKSNPNFNERYVGKRVVGK